jgi:hypothetical protein
MDPFLTYVPLISATKVSALFIIALLNFSTVRRNLQKQSEQEIYSRIMDARLKLENTEVFTKMAKGSPIFAERFVLVDSPQEYYIIVAFFDLFEFLFRLHKKGMVDSEIWFRWKSYVKTMMTVPQFKNVWDKTKDVHGHEFRDFIDSL